jgi:hypothetical protein
LLPTQLAVREEFEKNIRTARPSDKAISEYYGDKANIHFCGNFVNEQLNIL